MADVQRSSDIVEIHSEHALSSGLGSLALFGIAGLLYAYRGNSGMFVPLAAVLLLIGVVFIYSHLAA